MLSSRASVGKLPIWEVAHGPLGQPERAQAWHPQIAVASPAEFCGQELLVERRVVCHDYCAVELRQQVRSDLGKRGSLCNIRVVDLVNERNAGVAARVDERRPRLSNRAVGLDADQRHFDHSVCPTGSQTGCLEVDHRVRTAELVWAVTGTIAAVGEQHAVHAGLGEWDAVADRCGDIGLARPRRRAVCT